MHILETYVGKWTRMLPRLAAEVVPYEPGAILDAAVAHNYISGLVWNRRGEIAEIQEKGGHRAPPGHKGWIPYPVALRLRRK